MSSTTSVLITGGAGFIGRALAGECLRAGFRVTAFDNLCAGRRENLAEYGKAVELIEGDILDVAAFDAALEACRPQIVFHLAAHHFIPFCNDHPRETMRVNVEGTYGVLSAAASRGVAVSVVASSGVLYPGRPGPLSEDDAIDVQDIYGLTKSLDEGIARYVSARYAMRCLVARLFNTYGPFETNPHLIPHIVGSLRAGPSVRLGNLHTKRDYIYVQDTAALLLALARCAHERFAIANVGSGVEYSAADVIAELERLLGCHIEVEVDSARVRAQDKPHQVADLGRLNAITGLGPRWSLARGLEELLRHEGLL